MSEPRLELGTGAAVASSGRERLAAAGPSSGTSDPAPSALASLARDLEAEWTTLEAELEEIRLLVNQARTEAARHDEKRVAAATRLEAARRPGNEGEALDAATGLAAATRRAAVMHAQIDVLEGKLKALGRYRDSLATTSERLARLDHPGIAQPPQMRTRDAGGSTGGGAAPPGLPARSRSADSDPAAVAPEGTETLPPATSRIVLAAQEELRREIARTMHDGPAQSLTNIVLQAQIVERLVGRDPDRAATEMRQLVSMVQQTLDATKSFIFDVRPMVLDDLGLVPTIRRAVRERSRRAQIPVVFESFGADRRVPMELESGLFRIIDEALAAYLEGHPERVVIRLEWSDNIEARIQAVHPADATFETLPVGAGAGDGDMVGDRRRGGRRRDRTDVEGSPERAAIPAALAAMIESTQRAAHRAVGLSPAAWREIQRRADPIGLHVELLDDGRELRVDSAPDSRESAPD